MAMERRSVDVVI
uniref:Uncharacterized protein n=1 Tax=Zea mays TaxID=4577 RepID=C4IYU0_MAIZE|nr:unknown [Zea mays]